MHPGPPKVDPIGKVDPKPFRKTDAVPPIRREKLHVNPATFSPGAGTLRDPGASPGTIERHEIRELISRPTPVSPRAAFAALDSAPLPPATWVHAGTRRAEAGFLDPALGWVGVRAEAAETGLHASLTPSSAEAAQELGSQLAGLSAYVSEHHGPSATVTMAAYEDDQSGAGFSPGNQSEPGTQGNEAAPGARQELPSERTAVHAPATPAVAIGASALAGDARYISVVV